MYIYENLKLIREELNLSQNAFAEKLGVNVSNVSRWESLENGMSLETAVKISEKLNVTLSNLIEKDLSTKKKKKTIVQYIDKDKENKTFANRLKILMSENNIKATELSQKTKISKSQISHWLSGDYKAKNNKIMVLANYFNVNESWLAGYNVPKKISEKDKFLITKISELNDQQKEAIIQVIINMK